MKNASHWVKFVLVLALAFLSVPAARAATADDFWNKAGLSDYKDELGIFGAKLDSVEPGDKIWSGGGSLFGLPSIKFYLYWASASPLPLPVVAIPLPVNLTVDTLTKYVFDGDGYLNLGLTSPIVFWAPKDVDQLKSADMPLAVSAQAKKAGLPDTMRLAQGFNLFGRVSGGSFLGELTKLGFPNPNNLTVGVARRTATEKDKATKVEHKFKIVNASVALSADTSWRGPFGLANTSISGATLRFSAKTDLVTKVKLKTKETWGTLKIKDKDYVAYLERDSLGLKETLAFDTKSASLKNFFDIAEVLTATLGLPKIPFPSGLPLAKVAFSNPSHNDKVDPASPPDFDSMMFAGTKDAENLLNNKLIVNAGTRIFGWDVLDGEIKATNSGVDGQAKLRAARIGPIETPSASFYLKVNLTEQAMGIKAKAPVYGELDLKAATTGLELHIPANCPWRPVGLKAVLSDLTLTDFPVSPDLKDCFSGEIKKIVDGVVVVGGDVIDEAGDVASAAAAKAGELGNAAKKAFDEVNPKRVAAWAPAIVTHSDAVKAGQSAVGAAEGAFQKAGEEVSKLGEKIGQLQDKIKDLGNQIANLLKRLWAFVSGEVKKLQGERSAKIAERDDRRTEQAAAAARRDAAKDLKEKAQKGLDGIPGPSVSGSVAELERDTLAQLAQIEVQRRVAVYASTLAGELKDNAKSKAMLGDAYKPADKSKKDPLETFEEDRAAAFSAEYKTLSQALANQAMENYFTDSKKALVAQAVAKRIDVATEQALGEAVTALPTMAFGVPVYIKPNWSGEYGSNQCVGASGINFSISRACSNASERFVFRASGKLETANGNCVGIGDGDRNAPGRVVNQNVCRPRFTGFYFDPVDGIIRNTLGQCLSVRPPNYAGSDKVVSLPCTDVQPGGRGHWRLVAADSTQRAAATTQRAAATTQRSLLSLGAPGAAGVPAEGTNLGRLHLLPLPK